MKHPHAVIIATALLVAACTALSAERVAVAAPAAAVALNEPLRAELLAMAVEDQRVRQTAPSLMTDEQWAEIKRVDARSQQRIEAIIAQYGWPEKSLVGADGAHSAWLLVQHCDPAFQEKCLTLMERAVAAGEATGKDYAYLLDRVLMHQGKPQIYGTQFRTVAGRTTAHVIADPEHLDERRSSVGLGPWAEYDQQMRQRDAAAEASVKKLSAAAPDTSADRLLTDAEIKGLERENAMWRLVRPEEDTAVNLARLRAAGFTADEIATLQPKLVALWEVPFERNFGWLRPETVEQVQAVDRQFTARMRGTRLFEATGIRAGGEAPLKVDVLNRLWRGAILRALGYDEIAEFRLMNSTLAREETRRVQGQTLTEDEVRTLFVWRREYDAKQVPPQPDAGLSSVQQEARLDQWWRVRDLLGDERFVHYLEHDHPGFENMRRALEKAGVPGASVALDLWWLRQKEGYVRNQEARGTMRDELTAALRIKAAALMGEAPLAEYLRDDDARWLVIRGGQRRPVAGIGVNPPRELPPDATTVPARKTNSP